MRQSISFYVIQSGAGSCLGPRTPGNQSRRFPPLGPLSATEASRQPPEPVIKIIYSEMLSLLP